MKKMIIVLSSLIAVLVLFIVVISVLAARHVENLPKAEITLGKTDFEVEVADTLASRAQGLSGREALGKNEGMIFLFPIAARYGFWMKDMKFPLDILWIKDNKVVGISENVPVPEDTSMIMLPSYYPPEMVNKVLEIRAGEAKANSLKVGDLLTLKMKSR